MKKLILKHLANKLRKQNPDLAELRDWLIVWWFTPAESKKISHRIIRSWLL